MPTPLDLREFAAALPEQNLSPGSLNASVCNNITAAVAALTKQSPSLNYTIDRVLLKRIVDEYLQTHRTHNNPFNLLASREQGRCRVDYYDLSYGTEKYFQGKYEFIPQLGQRVLVDGEATSSNGKVKEGKWQYVEQAKGMYLVDGIITFPSGEVQEGKWQYVELLKGMYLVDGKTTHPNGEVKEGKWQYVEQAKGMYLVDGKITYPSREVREGKWEYVEQKRCMQLVEGKKILFNGGIEEGKYAYVEQLKGMCLEDGKTTFPDGEVEKGKWQYVEQLKNMYLVEGKRTAPDGDVYSGTFAYVPGISTGDTQLVNGTLTYATSRSETGEFAYIPQLNSMKLVNGTTKNAEGEVVKQGRREYVPQKNGMMLIEGLSVFSDGTRQEGTRSYIPELNEVVLTAGSITHGNKVQKGTWAYSQFENKMVFTAEQPKPKLPQHVRNQIQSAVQELVNIQRRFDSSGQFNTSAAILNTIAEQAALAQNPLQYNTALQTFSAQYTTLTRQLSLLTHPDKLRNYSADIHGPAFQKLGDLRESIDGQVNRWKLATVDWS